MKSKINAIKSILQTIKAIIISARYYFPWELCEDYGRKCVFEWNL